MIIDLSRTKACESFGSIFFLTLVARAEEGGGEGRAVLVSRTNLFSHSRPEGGGRGASNACLEPKLARAALVQFFSIFCVRRTKQVGVWGSVERGNFASEARNESSRSELEGGARPFGTSNGKFFSIFCVRRTKR